MELKVRKKFKYIVILEIIVLLIMTFGVIKIYNKKALIEYDLSKWTSDYISYKDDCWYIDKDIFPSNEAIDLICGPGIGLYGGVYWVTVDFECENDQSFVLLGDNGESYLRDNILKLPHDLSSVTHRFSFAENIDRFDVLIRYDGNGAFRINGITISQGLGGVTARTILVFSFCVFVIVDVSILLYEKICKNRKILASLLGITLLASLPLFYDGMGHFMFQDLDFHLNRIEAIVCELGNGKFPVKLSSYWNMGYGYPTSIYYGDILLYIPALLRLCGIPVMLAYKLYIFLIQAGTVVISYICFKKIWQNTDIALLTSLAYVTAAYRLVNVYVRGAVGEYSAMMFLPIIAMSIYKIYTEDNTDWRNYKKNALWLCLGMSGIVGTHILTTEMVVVTLLLICLILWRKTFHKNTIKVYLLAAVGTVLLNLYFIVPFIDFCTNVSVYITNRAETTVPSIQYGGAYIAQYFDFFHNVKGFNSWNINDRMQLTPGPVLMGVLFIAFYLWIQQKSSREIHFFAMFSILMLFVASNLFPWDALAEYTKFGTLLAQIQFPWRYIALAVIFLTLLMGCVIQKLFMEQSCHRSIMSMVVVGTCILMSCLFLHSYEDGDGFVKYKDSTELDTYSDELYLPVGTDYSENMFDGSVTSQNMSEVHLIHRKGTYMELYCETGILDGTVSLPVLNYKGYRILDEHGAEYEVSNGVNNTIQFKVPAGFSGKVFVDFVEPLSWRVAEVTSLLTLFALVLYAVPILNIRKKVTQSGRT